MSEFLAQSGAINVPQPVNLFAGSKPVSTNRAPLADENQFEQYQVIAILDGAIVPHNPAAADASAEAVGILCNSADTTTATGTTGQSAAYYNGGDFNHEALVWDASLTTLAQRAAEFLRTDIAISTIR